MKIIAQKNSDSNTIEFLKNSIQKDSIYGINLNIAYTKDNKIVVFNISSTSQAIINTIESSTLKELNNYEIILLDDILSKLSKYQFDKRIYINIVPSNNLVINDENIIEITKRMNEYVNELITIIDKYQNLTIQLHSTSQSIINILKQKTNNIKIGFVIYGDNLNYIDVNYYIITMNTFNDNIINLLLKNNKEVIIYIYSDYYISYIYEHYLGEKSTPHLQQVFKSLGIMTNYPEIVYKIFYT